MATNILPQDLIPNEIQATAIRRVKECFTQAQRKTRRSFKFQGVKFFSRSTTAGYVIPSRDNVVYLNLELFKKNEGEFLSTIIPHEVAHIVTDRVYPSSTHRPHRADWKKIMLDIFGLKPERCHDLDTKGIGKQHKKFVYICSCTKHTIGSMRHKKMSELNKKYTCRLCKKELVFLRSI